MIFKQTDKQVTPAWNTTKMAYGPAIPKSAPGGGNMAVIEMWHYLLAPKAANTSDSLNKALPIYSGTSIGK